MACAAITMQKDRFAKKHVILVLINNIYTEYALKHSEHLR